MQLSPDTPIMVISNLESVNEARKIGREILEKRLAASMNIIPHISALYFWPPESETFEENSEVVLVLKTFSSHYAKVEAEIVRLHPYITPFIAAVPYAHISGKYLDWMKKEIR